MSETLTIHSLSPAELCSRALATLLEREAENGLPLGLARRYAAQPELAPHACWLAVERAGQIVGAVVWTPPHDVVGTRLPAGAALAVAERILEHGARHGQVPRGALGPERVGLELAEALAARTGARVEVRMRHLVHELTALQELPQVPGAMRGAVAADVPLVARWYLEFAAEAKIAHTQGTESWASAVVAAGNAFFWQHGALHSLACLSRETPNGRAIGPVYTPPASRRNGYATALVAELSRRVLAEGKRFACLFTDEENPTSNHIYAQIGFRPLCRYDAYALVPAVQSAGPGAGAQPY